MKICLIGKCGHTAQAYKVLKQHAEITFCGIAPGGPEEQMHQSFDPAIPFYPDYLDMLEKTHPDMAVVSPVFALTGEVIIECAKRGIDVFAEKPVASSFEMLENVRKAVTESGIRFCAMHYLRYTPAFYHAAELVKKGEIGDVCMITAQKSYKYGSRPAWYGNRNLYGGTIPWVGIHAIDWIYCFSGKRFLSVSAQSFGKDPEMAALCRFEMEDGVMASANLDYYRPASAPTHGDDRVRCVGNKGVLEVSQNKIHLINGNGCTVIEPTTAPELMEEFLAGKAPIPSDEIFYLTKVALAARESADFGKTVRIED